MVSTISTDFQGPADFANEKAEQLLTMHRVLNRLDANAHRDILKEFKLIDKYSLFEQKLVDLEQNDLAAFESLDWECISAMKPLSTDFQRDYFKYLNVYALIVNQPYIESFVIEMLDILIPAVNAEFAGRAVDTDTAIDVKVCQPKINSARVMKSINCLHGKKMSSDFHRKYSYLLTESTSKDKKTKKDRSNGSRQFEMIINSIQEEHPDYYLIMDINAVSAYRGLSPEFTDRHLPRLSIKALFIHQRYSYEFLRHLANRLRGSDGRSQLPLDTLLITHPTVIDLDFIIRERIVMNSKNFKTVKMLVSPPKYKLRLISKFHAEHISHIRAKTGFLDDTLISVSLQRRPIFNDM